MKGLLIKDLCVLRNQKRLLPVFALLAVWFTFLMKDNFAFPFLTLMASILTISTITDDEVHHSLPFLFTLPFDRRTYVTEKFLLGGMLIAAGIALACLCSFARGIFVPEREPSKVGTALLFSVCAGIIILSLMIPVRIRFTGDQGRIILYTVYAAVALVSIVLTRALPGQKEQVTSFFENNAESLLPVLAVCFAAVFLAAGFFLANHWVQKKEL